MEYQNEAKSIRPLRPPATPRQEQLTPRQLEVLALLGEGLPNKLIARRLDMAGGTVKVHVVRILRALNVSSRLQAVIAARSLGLLDAPDVTQAALQETATALRGAQAAAPRLGKINTRTSSALPSDVKRVVAGAEA